jgi:hypothetical protein
MNKILINFRATENEFAHLKAYLAQTERTQTDVLRELIRSLEVRPKRAKREVKTRR